MLMWYMMIAAGWVMYWMFYALCWCCKKMYSMISRKRAGSQ
jgi:hypothetical protein